MAHSSDSLVFRADRPWPNARLKTGAIVGHATASSVRLWVRTGRPGDFSLLLYEAREAMESPAERKRLRAAIGVAPLTTAAATSGARWPGGRVPRRIDFEIPDWSSDTTHVLDITGLEPDTWYGYAVLARDDERMLFGHNRLRRFRTPPPEAERRPFRIALFSCHMPYRVSGLFHKRTELASPEMWDYLGATLRDAEDEVAVVIAGGDQAYADGVPTLDIWKLLNRSMRREGGQLVPDEEDMLSWYRDIYRGYWGFESVQRVFDRYPTYMIWDDHEIADGWGSRHLGDDGPDDGLAQMLPDLEDRGLSRADGRVLVQRMFAAAVRAYEEYQHSHNPGTAPGLWDYAFRRGGAAFYVLDGRGNRNIERDTNRILGSPQLERLEEWAAGLDPDETPFVFVTSAVPLLHARAALVGADSRRIVEALDLGDDLRDAWEHGLHDEERRALLAVLLGLARRGHRVAVLSGDVHVSAAFSIEDDGARIWQLTSSAISRHYSRLLSWGLRFGTADDGLTPDGHRFVRHALYVDASYALVRVDPAESRAWFEIYGAQQVDPPPGYGQRTFPLRNAICRIEIS